MSIENIVLMKTAKESLKGKWGLSIGTLIVYILITGVIHFIPILGSLVAIVLAGPLTLGLSMFWLAISRGMDVRLDLLFRGLNNIGNSALAYILMMIFTLLWTLLLIVPGIIASISYSMTFFIMADDNSIEARDAINKSKQMMQGYKWILMVNSLYVYKLCKVLR